MDKKKEREAFIQWWKKLQEDNGGRARLRRCSLPEEAILQSQTFRLRKRLPKWFSDQAVATLAGISSHVKHDSDKPLGLLLAKPKEKNGRPPMSEGRFRQLATSRDWDDLYRGLRRSMGIIDKRVSLKNLFDTIEGWNDAFRQQYKRPGKSIKFVLSKDYYTEAVKHEE